MSKKMIIIGVVVVALLGIGAFWFMGDDEHGSSGVVATSSSCSGGLFDSHVHLDDDDFARNIAPLMEQHGVRCGILFTEMDLDGAANDYEQLQDALADTPGFFIPFFDIIRNDSTVVTSAALDSLYQQYASDFKGFGEFALYQAGSSKYDLSNTDLKNQMWATVFQFAGEHNIVVMIHPTEQKRADLETVLQKYPRTKFLIHGFEFGPDGYIALLKKYPNVYYTLDAATMLKDAAPGSQKHLMYPGSGGSASQFVTEYDRDNAYFLRQAKEKWTKVMLAAPDRVMWGTDTSFSWHADPQVYDRLIEFSNEVIATLPGEVQQKYSSQNAVRLFGNNGVVLQSSNMDDEDDGDIEEDEEP